MEKQTWRQQHVLFEKFAKCSETSLPQNFSLRFAVENKPVAKGLCCCFEEDGKEMYQNVKRTCRAIVFAH